MQVPLQVTGASKPVSALSRGDASKARQEVWLEASAGLLWPQSRYSEQWVAEWGLVEGAPFSDR